MTGIRESLGLMVEAYRAIPQQVAGAMDRFVMSVHQPFEVPDGPERGAWCRNHWGGREPWPCDAYAEASRRIKYRLQAIQTPCPVCGSHQVRHDGIDVPYCADCGAPVE